MFIALLLVSNCSHKLQGERNILKDQLKEEVDGVKIFKEKQKLLFDSLSLENTKKDKRISELQENNKQLDKKLENSAKKLEKKKKEIVSYSYTQSAEYINEYFQGLDAIPTEKSVNLELNLPNLVVEELEEKQFLEEAIYIKDSIIKNKDEEIKLGNDKILNKDLALASKQIETEKLDKALDTSLQLNKKTEKQLKVQKVLKWIYAGAGAFLGWQIAK